MNWKREWKKLAVIMAVFLGCFWLPVAKLPFQNAFTESLRLARWYAREHVLLCLVLAFFIAGGIAVFVSKASVMKYLGAGANKVLAYGVAAASGTVLAVCSCTVLPLFAGIYRMGAGIGPATAFLYSGPAINALAIILTARVLGIQFGVARAVGAVVFSVVIGLLMHVIFRGEETDKAAAAAPMPHSGPSRPLWQNTVYFATMIGILVFANWGQPKDTEGIWRAVYSAKWLITGVFAIGFSAILVLWLGLAWWKVLLAGVPVAVLAFALPGTPMAAFALGAVGLSVITSTSKGEAGGWFASSWEFAKQILPLLLAGVLVAGALLGGPDGKGLIPKRWVAGAVGGNSLRANLFASVVGALMYFATLTEVPILQGLLATGMGKGPALALLLAGPALSLPNMLVIRSVLGARKTLVYVLLVVVMATVSGLIFGTFFR